MNYLDVFETSTFWLGLWWTFHPPLRKLEPTGWHPWD